MFNTEICEMGLCNFIKTDPYNHNNQVIHFTFHEHFLLYLTHLDVMRNDRKNSDYWL